MLKSTAVVPEPPVRTRPAQIRLLVVGRECDAIDRAFDDETEVTVESVPALESARAPIRRHRLSRRAVADDGGQRN